MISLGPYLESPFSLSSRSYVKQLLEFSVQNSHICSYWLKRCPNTNELRLRVVVGCRRCTSSLRGTGSSHSCWQRAFADEKKTGREGTTGEELSGDPNRVPQKGEQEKEGKGAMEVMMGITHTS